MPSINPRLSLAISFRRAEVRAFWMLATAALAATLWGAATMLGARMPWMWAAAAVALPLARLVYAEWFELGIRAWNKGTRLIAVALQRYVLKVSYHVLFAVVGRHCSSFDRASADRLMSCWIARVDEGPQPHRGAPSMPRQSAHGFFAAAQHRGSAWMIFIAPVVLLLRMLAHGQQDTAPSSSTYTLY
jgi:hypothetical protein